MFLFAVSTYVRSVETYGYPLSLEFGTRFMFADDTVMLFVSDGILVLSTAICVPFAKAIQKGWISYYRTGVILQHLWQTSVLFIAVKWTFARCVVMVMKYVDELMVGPTDNGRGCNRAILRFIPSS